MRKFLESWWGLVLNVNEEATLWMHLLSLGMIPVYPAVYLVVMYGKSRGWKF